MTKTNAQQMQDAYQRTRAEIASLADWLECELEKFDENEELDWASVGSLQHVKENLLVTLEFLSGTDRDEIQRNLDELRM
jgi:uncharacterized pyridoxal phosphate-containing UPF0001 family protein